MQRWHPSHGCYLVFLGPAMFDKIPGEVYLTSVTPPLLGLSEVTMDISVSHTFLHSSWSTAICNLFSALFSSAFLSSQAWIYLLPFPSPLHSRHSSHWQKGTSQNKSPIWSAVCGIGLCGIGIGWTGKWLNHHPWKKRFSKKHAELELSGRLSY